MSQDSNPNPGGRPPLAALRRFSQPQTSKELCDLCSVELPHKHAHLLDPQNRQILCACTACAILFSGKADTKFRRIPERVRFLPEFQMEDVVWEGLLIPVGMAFFFENSQAGKVTAFYPSPGGAIESLLSLDAWDELVQGNPVLREMQPDVEALLVNRLKGAKEYYLVPIDKCYELVGLIRIYWKGLSGGTEVWEEIGKFYAGLKAHSETPPTRTGGNGHA